MTDILLEKSDTLSGFLSRGRVRAGKTAGRRESNRLSTKQLPKPNISCGIGLPRAYRLPLRGFKPKLERCGVLEVDGGRLVVVGKVVTREAPEGVVAAESPARVTTEISASRRENPMLKKAKRSWS